MADINVERRGPSIVPWIIGLVVLALLAWLLWSWLGNRDRDDRGVVTGDTLYTDTVAPGTMGPVDTFPTTGTGFGTGVDTPGVVPGTTGAGVGTTGTTGTTTGTPGTTPVDTAPPL